MIFEPLVFFVLLGLVMTPPRVISSEVIFSRSGQITSFKLADKTCISGLTVKKGLSKHCICKSEYWQDSYMTGRAKSKVNIVFKPTYLAPKVELFFAVCVFPYHVVGHFCIYTQVGCFCFVGCHATHNIRGRRIEVVVFNGRAVEPDHLFDVWWVVKNS